MEFDGVDCDFGGLVDMARPIDCHDYVCKEIE
jgi:hypothetical protein